VRELENAVRKLLLLAQGYTMTLDKEVTDSSFLNC